MAVEVDIHTNTNAYLHESDFKKPGAFWPVAMWCMSGLKLKVKIN